MADTEYLLSVCMITYNHAKYVEEAIRSVFEQETDFTLELVICDDCSSDQTPEIISRLIASAPFKVQYHRNKLNEGMMPNFMQALKMCRGKYIAICEGDDYWTDHLKLQKQVDFLESSNDYVLCFHNAIVKYEQSGQEKLFNTYKRKTYYGSDLLKQWLVPTASSVFRNCIPEHFPDFFNNATHGDLALFLYLSEFGPMRLMEGVMSVYRVNDGGVTQHNFSGISHNVRHIAQIDSMQLFFKRKYKRLFKSRKADYLLSNAQMLSSLKRKKEGRDLFRLACKISVWRVLSRLKTCLKFVYLQML